MSPIREGRQPLWCEHCAPGYVVGQVIDGAPPCAGTVTRDEEAQIFLFLCDRRQAWAYPFDGTGTTEERLPL